MAVDTSELVFELERRFRVDLTGPLLGRSATVADLAAVIVDRLPQSSEPRGTSPSTVRAVFDVLKLDFGVHGTGIRPSTPLADALGSHRRAMWERLQKRFPTLPPLTIRPSIGMVLLTLFGVPALGWLVACFVIARRYEAEDGWLWALAGFPALWLGFRVACWAFASEFPSGVHTVRDLVRCVEPLRCPCATEERRIVERRVLDEVRRILADFSGVQRAQIGPQSVLISLCA